MLFDIPLALRTHVRFVFQCAQRKIIKISNWFHSIDDSTFVSDFWGSKNQFLQRNFYLQFLSLAWKIFFPGTWHARNTPRWVIFSVCAGNSFAQTTNLCCLQGTILRWKNLMNNILPLRWEGNLRTIVIGFDGEDLQWSGRILLGDNKHRLGLQALPLFLCIFVWLKICQEKEAWETPQKRVTTRSMHI